MIEDAQVAQMYHERKALRGPEINRCMQVARHYDGDVVVPVPEMDEYEKSMAVNLLGPGLDSIAMRIASTGPDISCTPVRPNIPGSVDKAADRRRALLGWWSMNRLDMVMRRRARYLLGYATSPVSISPVALNSSDKRDIPHWRVLNPLSTFPAPMADLNDIEPSDCIYAFSKPLSWLMAMYPDETRLLYKGKSFGPDTMFEILEYSDSEESLLLAMGQERDQSPDRGFAAMERPADGGTMAYVRLGQSVRNYAGVCLTVYPGRITLNKLFGMFDQLMPLYHNASKLAALEFISIKRSVFDDRWLVSHPQSPGAAEIITYADGLTDVIGEIRNGMIQQTQSQPSMQAAQAQDRLERTGRLQAGLPAELGGESATNIRTARRGETVLGSAIDMPIQEAQEIFEDSLEAENCRAIAVAKGYWGAKKTSFYIPKHGRISNPDYTPNDVFDTDQNVVKYGITGTDANSFVIAAGQRLQMETLSQETFMEMDPLVEDVQEELGRIWVGSARRAMMSSVETQASQGQIAPDFIARFAKALQDGKVNPEDALTEVHSEMQREQAAQAAAAGPPGAGAPPPGAMPGMTGAPGVQGGVPMPPPGQGALSQILGNLRKPAAQSGPERAMAAPPPNALAQ